MESTSYLPATSNHLEYQAANPTPRTTSVTVRAALARRKRKLRDDSYAPQLMRSTPRENDLGKWLLVENNFVKDGFHIGRLTDYLQETDVLAKWEYLVEPVAA
jgi:hypothetical protein